MGIVVDEFREEREQKFAIGQESSDYQVNKILRESEKAVYCTLKKGNLVSDACFWVPRSVLSSKLFIDNWFVENKRRHVKYKRLKTPRSFLEIDDEGIA